MMSVDKHLFWVLQDKDINNEELFFPPDTPIGSINLTKARSKLIKRHERQLKRLVEQQLQELRRFQKKFSERYDHQVYQNPAPPVCEFINGMDFLREFGADLASLVNVEVGLSQTQQNNVEKLCSDKKRRDSKNMIEARKLDYSLAFRRRFRNGFDSIENDHKQQVERLKSMQNEELSVLDDLISGKPQNEKKEKEVTGIGMKRPRDLEKDRLAKERMKEKNKIQKRVQELEQEVEQNKQQQAQQAQQQQKNPQSKANKKKRLNKNIQPNSPPHSPPISFRAQLDELKKMEPQRKIQKHKLKAGNAINTPLRGPPTVVSSTPNRQSPSTRPPTIAASKIPSNNKARPDQPAAPLFHSKRAKKHTEPVVLTDTGAFTIQSKPNRVVIRSRVLGDPKDYDDAINNYKRTTPNPVTRRFYKGKPHLFYKTPTGEILNVGSVAQIKPTITDFLLRS